MKQQMQFLVGNLLGCGLSLEEARTSFEKEFIVLVLMACKGNQCKAASELGMHRNTLNRQIKRLKIDPKIIRGVRLSSAAELRIEKRKPIRAVTMGAHAGA